MAVWTFELAHDVLDRVRSRDKQIAVFECGFGPSGLPHIGTVAEMLRTRMVIRAFNEITKSSEDYYSTQWILFADDLDALRRVPDTVPADKKELMESYIGVSVCDIPDPWGTHESFAAHNIAELVRLLEQCGVDRSEYILLTASTMYRSGQFNETLRKLSRKADEIADIVTHDYSAERTASYWPFLPIIDGRVIQEIYSPEMLGIEVDPHFDWWPSSDLNATPNSTSLFDGNVKCQWKLDWPMRWMALDVDFEMHGKDLIGSAKVGRDIFNLFNMQPPVIFQYELFLDDEGKKISKSKGNGLEADEWLNYGTVESLEYFLFQNPVRGRSLSWNCIPQYMDMYSKELDKFTNDGADIVGSALWHIHGTNLPPSVPITYSMLLNITAIADTEDEAILWRYINAYQPNLTPETHPALAKMVPGAIRYYQKFVLPSKVYRSPTDEERITLRTIANMLRNPVDDIRVAIYDIGKDQYGENRLRDYFQMLYQMLLKQNSGPQFHQFVQVIGPDETVALINTALERYDIGEIAGMPSI